MKPVIGGVAALIAAALAVVPAQAEIVQTPPGSTTGVQISVAMDNDWQFADAECLFIPILATYGRADDTSILGETTVTKVGAGQTDNGETDNEGTFLVLPGDPVSGQVLDEVFVCPADGTGEYHLDTIARAIAPNAEESVLLDPLTFWVRPAQSSFADVSATSIKGGVRVVGTVVAGEGAATGVIEVRYATPAKKRTWSAPLITAIDQGAFSLVIPKTLAAGTRIKATLTRCSWCSRTTQTARVR